MPTMIETNTPIKAGGMESVKNCNMESKLKYPPDGTEALSNLSRPKQILRVFTENQKYENL